MQKEAIGIGIDDLVEFLIPHIESHNGAERNKHDQLRLRGLDTELAEGLSMREYLEVCLQDAKENVSFWDSAQENWGKGNSTDKRNLESFNKVYLKLAALEKRSLAIRLSSFDCNGNPSLPDLVNEPLEFNKRMGVPELKKLKHSIYITNIATLFCLLVEAEFIPVPYQDQTKQLEEDRETGVFYYFCRYVYRNICSDGLGKSTIFNLSRAEATRINEEIASEREENVNDHECRIKSAPLSKMTIMPRTAIRFDGAGH